MEDFETLSVSDSFDLHQSLTTSPSLKGSFLSQVKQGEIDQKLLGIISSNLYKDPGYLAEDCFNANLRLVYTNLKKQYISSEAKKQELQKQLRDLIASQTPCKQCKLLTEDNMNSKKALDQAIQLSHVLLSEVYKLSIDN